jgi:hypothetical protein
MVWLVGQPDIALAVYNWPPMVFTYPYPTFAMIYSPDGAKQDCIHKIIIYYRE